MYRSYDSGIEGFSAVMLVVLLILVLIAILYAIALIAQEGEEAGLSKGAVWFICLFTTPLIGGLLVLICAVNSQVKTSRWETTNLLKNNHEDLTRLIKSSAPTEKSNLPAGNGSKSNDQRPETAESVAEILGIPELKVKNVLRYYEDHPKFTASWIGKTFSLPEEQVVYILTNLSSYEPE